MGAKRTSKSRVKGAPEWTAPWLIYFFQRHIGDEGNQAVPGREFLASCPTNVVAKLIAIIKAVADAPPPMFGGGGKWEVMHDEMKGYYEARADGKGREHFRLFCLLEREGALVGLGGPSVIIITGARKPFQTRCRSSVIMSGYNCSVILSAPSRFVVLLPDSSCRYVV